MKIKDGFILRKMAGTTVVIPDGEDMDMDMMITLNDTGCFLWEHMQEETTVEELTAAVLKEFDVAEDAARNYIVKFTDRLKELEFLA